MIIARTWCCVTRDFVPFVPSSPLPSLRELTSSGFCKVLRAEDRARDEVPEKYYQHRRVANGVDCEHTLRELRCRVGPGRSSSLKQHRAKDKFERNHRHYHQEAGSGETLPPPRSSTSDQGAYGVVVERSSRQPVKSEASQEQYRCGNDSGKVPAAVQVITRLDPPLNQQNCDPASGVERWRHYRDYSRVSLAR